MSATDNDEEPKFMVIKYSEKMDVDAKNIILEEIELESSSENGEETKEIIIELVEIEPEQIIVKEPGQIEICKDTPDAPIAEPNDRTMDEIEDGKVKETKVDAVPGCSTVPEISLIPQKTSVQLFAEDTGPQLYDAKCPLVTLPIITKNLPKVFEYLPIHGKPQDKNMKEFFSNKIKEFVGSGLTDDEFQELEDYCSPNHLKTGREIVMGTNVPVMGVPLTSGNIIHNLDEPPEVNEDPDLCILKKNKVRIEKDTKGLFTKKLKYRGVRNLPFTQEMYHNMPATKPTIEVPDLDLEPGKDVLYRVRVYRPYTYSMAKERFTRTRHSVFCYDIILTGRHRLSELRDRFVCHNDFDMRVDVSNNPDMLPNAKAKELFPSGFLFINNVFYVDTREGCVDYSEPIRDWAIKKKLGNFPKKDMCSVKLEDLVLKLGYPEVYVHQGNCEHVFLFSEVRLLNPTDPLRLHNYPCSTAIAQNQTVYCTTCAEFSAKWIVVGCSRVPFDPAFFCETCFKQYLYKDGKKIGDFKAYSYRGNALNVLKP
ncbi:snRNA-activating protein complex subunit 3 [Spodoptera litura]|uniref:snRNA-activating protein complex subunit 3 n=1 Tax=Spodoptera litura TaxID=69820 RepID=A0A9J7EBS8_SPOLT|nr:snRNA-activating protein complex subunit 3 [Spodoptera litura]